LPTNLPASKLTMDAIFGTGLAVTNGLALSSWLVQWKPLVGDDGIVPAKDYVARARELVFAGQEEESAGKSRIEKLKATWQRNWSALRRCPTIFLLTGVNDRIMQATIAAGYLCIFFMLMGWLPCLAAACFAVIWASIANVSNPFTGLQFESLLCESNMIFAAGYLFSAWAPSAWVLMGRILIVRLMLGAGFGKLGAGDKTWRNGKALSYHYLTQPLPNFLSRKMHNLPLWWHKVETHLTFLFEGPLTFLFFFPDWRWRLVGFVGTAMFNFNIGITGNYGFLHVLTVNIALSVIAEMGTTVTAPFCGQAMQRSLGSSMFTPWVIKAVHSASNAASAFYQTHPEIANAGSTPPFLLYQSCPEARGLVSPLLAAIPWPWKVISSSLGLAGWAAGWTVALAYLLISLVPFSSTFGSLVSFNEELPVLWPWANKMFDLLQKWRFCGLYSEFADLLLSETPFFTIITIVNPLCNLLFRFSSFMSQCSLTA
jgi:Lipase maturation factor